MRDQGVPDQAPHPNEFAGPRRMILPLLLLLLISFTHAARGQEVLVPIDKQGRLERIDLRLEQKLRLFPDYRDFREARLFQLADSSYVLEIAYGPEGRLSRSRLPMTLAEVETLRRNVSGAVALRAPQAVLDQDGRTKLLIGTTILSLGYYGWAFPVAIDASGGSEVLGLYMLTAGTAMILPIVLTKEQDVTDAASTLCLYGATRGIIHGTLVHLLFTNGNGEGRSAVTAGWLASMAEGVIGFAIADREKMTKGHAEMIGAGGDAGMLLGLGAAILSEPEDAGTAGIVLAGSAAGMIGGHMLAADGRFTRGDSYLFRGGGTLGSLLGVTLASAFDLRKKDDDGDSQSNDKVYVACAMAGGVAGLAYGTGLARKTNLTGAEGVMVNVGMLGGGLLGLGVMVLAGSNTESGFPYLMASSVGATAGFALAYRLVAPGTDEAENGPSWNLEISPRMAGLAGSAERNRASNLDPVLSLCLSCQF
jgi:hypothetical protein